jgi:NAD(P)-dependent dehydrogenase (short-subunit alcohol dehydrogenase family)
MGTEQKVAVITGASQGIGAALVRAYRDRDYRVVATARSVKPSNGPDILVVPGDIADRKTAQRAISQGMSRFGRIDPHCLGECLTCSLVSKITPCQSGESMESFPLDSGQP